MSKEIVPCDICGVIPELRRSQSSSMISHKCRDYHSGWSNWQKVIDDWNASNSQESKESVDSTQQLKAEIAEFAQRVEDDAVSGAIVPLSGIIKHLRQLSDI